MILGTASFIGRDASYESETLEVLGIYLNLWKLPSKVPHVPFTLNLTNV